MKLTPKDIRALRRAIAEGLPTIDQAGSVSQQAPALTYMPPSHAKALDPDSCLVEGIRGAGKSFWWAALSSGEHRRFVQQAFPDAHLSAGAVITQGFGDATGSLDAPSKDVLASLTKAHGNPRAIWRAVVAHQLGFQSPFPQKVDAGQPIWAARTAWVLQNPEQFDVMLLAADASLQRKGQMSVVLFDALDRLAESWKEIRPLARGLLQVAQDMRATRCIRLKLFVRPDMLEDREIIGFPDASKLLARRANLNWRKVDLYALFFQCVGNASGGGPTLRKLTSETLRIEWKKAGSSWLIPKDLCGDEDLQERLFESLAGKAMSASSTGLKRGKPYKWVANHLQDGRDQVSPRSFCEALRKAAEMSISDFDGHDLPLHFKSIQAGVQKASSVRVDELVQEDYPWVSQVMDPLRGELTVPCEAKDIHTIWKRNKVLDTLNTSVSDSRVKLPPQHLVDGFDGVLRDLLELGLIQRLTDGRVQMPDVYRIAFGLGRRGGVKPLK